MGRHAPRIHAASQETWLPGASCFSARRTPKELTLPTGQPRAAISWSGGKDSCAALHRTHAQYDVVCMITMFDDAAARSRSHGLRPEVVDAQAARLGLRRITGRCSWQSYDATFADALREAKADGVTHVIFGDILFDEHRAWADRQCAAQGLTAVEPLFGSSTLTLFNEWIASGAEAIIVTARAALLDESWLGRPLRAEMLDELARLGVDPCGERGEYHTAVTNSPLFSAPMDVELGERVFRSDCWALDLNVAQTSRSAGAAGLKAPATER